MTTVDQFLAEKLNSWVINDFPIGNLFLCVIAILLCVLLTGFVGLEREKRGRSAGLRTHLLVGLGSCIIMIISIYGFPSYASRDVARLAAGVLAGVGFLGAGAIIHFNGSIKGLTTAGTIWLAMAIGLACGSFNFILAAGATLVVLIVLITFRRMERRLLRHSPSFIILANENTPVISYVLSYAKEHELIVSEVDTQIVKNGDQKCIETIFKLTKEKKGEFDPHQVEKDLLEITKAISVQLVNPH